MQVGKVIVLIKMPFFQGLSPTIKSYGPAQVPRDIGISGNDSVRCEGEFRA